ncbi:unnamed protein product [Heterobilharzia americana]|nr:unnamed protein product [Heterobilharzia americana]CAH8654159.1 unnamed protein product [Heterobilharzia americana]
MVRVDLRLKYKTDFNSQTQSTTSLLPELSFEEVEEYFSELWSEQMPSNEIVNGKNCNPSTSAEMYPQILSSSSSDEHLCNNRNHFSTNRLSISLTNAVNHRMNLVENKRRRRWKTMARSMIPKEQFFIP